MKSDEKRSHRLNYLLKCYLINPKENELFHKAKQNKTDGIKFIWDNKWVHLRGSNTEPIIRIYAEAPTDKEAKDLVVKVKSLL